MRISMLKTCAAAAVCALLAGPASALSLTDPGVVGVANALVAPGGFGAPDTLITVAQHLLDMAANTKDAPGCVIAVQGASCYQTSTTEYSATLPGTNTKVDGLNGQNQNVSGLGYTYLLAKYDGPNAGYVLFHIPTYGASIPGLSNPLWANPQGQGYGISGYMAWGGTAVPDGGATLSLLGLAFAGIGAARRFMKA